MFIALTASADTYITDKIISNTYRAKASNVGRAGTLDLFKLYDESRYEDKSGNVLTSSIHEKTRILLNFDLEHISGLTSSICDINSDSFKAKLQLFDIASGLPVPNDFKVIVNPLSKSFDEGRGRDVSRFSDVDSCNYITSSFSNGSNILWESEGCNAGGGLAYVKAVATLTVTDGTISGTIVLSDGESTVTFSSAGGATTPAKTDATNYTYGIQGVDGVNTAASRIFAAIALAKTNGDLKITAVDPGGSSAVISLKQDAIGPAGNTAITGTAIDANDLTIVGFKDGYDPSSLDYFTSGTLDGLSYDFGAAQLFSEGNEDLDIDITTAVSASLAGIIPMRGFRIAFSGTMDSDEKTRFAKRLLSRHSKNRLKTPRILVTFDTHIDDYHPKMRLNKEVKLFLTNKVNGKLENVRSGSEPGTPAGTIHPLTGTNCMKVTLTSGSVVKTFDVSQYLQGTDRGQKTGTYFANVKLSRFDADLFEASNKKSKMTFSEVWSSNDLTVPYYSGTLEVTTNHADGDTPVPDDILVTPIGNKDTYSCSEDVVIRFFLEDISLSYSEQPFKIPISKKSVIVDDVFYRIKDKQTSQVIVPFDTTGNSTKLSTDGNGMYMSFKCTGLPIGRPLEVELLFQLEGSSKIIELPDLNFRVIKK